jgi:hypothetical protein
VRSADKEHCSKKQFFCSRKDAKAQRKSEAEYIAQEYAVAVFHETYFNMRLRMNPSYDQRKDL